MELQVTDNPASHRFEIFADGELAGFVTYADEDGAVSLLHTETSPGLRGRGIAGRLIQVTLTTLASRGASVLPYCPFIQAWITAHPDYRNLVPESRRTEFGL